MTAQLPSRERLERVIQLDDIYDPELTKALARFALAAHEQEPIGEVIEMHGGLIMDGVINLDSRTYREISGLNKMKRMPLGTKFYAHPAPSIPAAHFVPEMAAVGEMPFLGTQEKAFVSGWNACRAAMLNHPEQHLDMVDHSGDVNKKVAPPIQSGNSAQPVTVHAGYVLVPVEPTTNQWAAGMQAFDSGMDKVTRVYKAMLAAAPKAPDGWIPVSERMPENNSYVSVVSRHGEYVSGLVNGEWLELHDGSSFPVSEIYLWLTLPCLPSKPLPDAPKGV